MVPRYGTSELIGASRVSENGKHSIVWDTARVVPLTVDYCREYSRELRDHIERGELKARTDKEWEAYQKASAKAARSSEEPKK